MQPTKSKNKLGLWMTTSLVVGNMIGAGVFLMPAALASFGGISVLGWILSAVCALILATIFSRLSKMMPAATGGPYAFSRAGLGDFIGFMVAWGYWISVWISNAAIAIAFVGAMSVFFPILEENRTLAVFAALTAIWLLTWVNSRGIRSSGRVQLITTILKLLPLLIIILGGALFFNADNFVPFNASDLGSWDAISVTAALTFFAFLGIESATIPAGDVDQPEKTIPRATLMGTIIASLFYILSTVVVMGMIPLADLATSPAPFADAMAILAGGIGEKLVAAGAAIAAFGALNGWILIQGQIAMATARDQLFPKIFKKENKNGVPLYGLIIGSALTSIVMLMNYTDGLVEQFSFMILLATLCTLIPYLFSSAAYIILNQKKSLTSKVMRGIYVLGGLGFLFSLGFIYGTGEKSVFWGTILLLAGTPFYIWQRRK